MSNSERKVILETLTSLYSTDDYETTVYHMPDEISDPTGEEFNEYFDFLQRLFMVKGGYMFMGEGELQAQAAILRSDAMRYSYPVSQLVVL